MTHRHFHYNPDTGESTPVEPIKLPDGRTALVPLEVIKQIKRQIYRLEKVHPDCADATIEAWELDDDE